jgi:hypothetical protein
MSRVVAAGDSSLDLDMLKVADLALAPAHGELYSLYLQRTPGLEKIKFTQKNGIEAAEEILKVVADYEQSIFQKRTCDNIKVYKLCAED